MKGNGNAKGRYIGKTIIERAIVAQIVSDFQSDAFVDALLRAAHTASNEELEDTTKNLRAEVVTLNGQISKAADLALQLEDSAPMMRKIQELEARRHALVEEIGRIEKERELQTALSSVTREQVAKLVQDLSADLAEAEQPRLKACSRPRSNASCSTRRPWSAGSTTASR